MAPARTHIVGAGLAGLSTALRLSGRGLPVALYEAAGQAGGRCRSFHDQRLDRRIDNGNHLVLTGNRSVRAYLALAGRPEALVPARRALFPFADLESGRRWEILMNDGPLPWWIALPGRRVPGTRIADYLGGWRLARAGAGATVAQAITDRGPLWRGFWEPLTLAALNTTPEHGAAALLWQVLRETFLRGAAHSRPMFAPEGLGAALVTPALETLKGRGVAPAYSRPLKALSIGAGRVTGLVFAGGETVTLAPGEQVVLALPPARLRAILPELDPPEDRGAILNAHFVVEDAQSLAGRPPLLGVLGSKTHWIFTRGDVISLTVSAADRLGLIEMDRDRLTEALWAETRQALGLGERPYRAARLITEKRATFDQSPAGVAKRPDARTPLANLFLAGDAIDTGLPATIEGAIRSGERAAELVGQELVERR